MLLTYQKRGSVDFTIVGSLSVVDGVASGFSYEPRQYVAINQTFTPGTNDFEIKTAFVANSIQGRRILATQSEGGTISGITIGSNGSIYASFYKGSSSITSITSSVSYTTGQKYYVIMYRKGTTIGIKVSIDNVSYTENTNTIGADVPVLFNDYNAYKLIIGANLYTGFAFDGSVDLNYTYIKIDEQPWFGICPIEVKHINYGTSVGYTKVGSPTIVNGVASGFSADDYLKLPTASPTATTGYNFRIDFTTGSTVTEQILFYNSVSNFIVYTSSSGRLALVYTRNGTAKYPAVSTNALDTNTKYSFVASHDGTDLTCTITSNGTVLDTVTYTGADLISFTSGSRFGVALNGTQQFDGSIDLNNTYIKVNGKLWFAHLKVQNVTCNGTTVWSAL